MAVAEAPECAVDCATADAADVKELYAKDSEAALKEAGGLESVTLSSEDLEWVHVLAEGWATPLDGFMTEQQYLSCLHYQMIVEDGAVVPMPVPIVLPVTDDVKAKIEGKPAIALKNGSGEVVAVLRDLEIYPHRKEERATRTFGINADRGHPYVDKIFEAGDWLVGGKIEVLHLPEGVWHALYGEVVAPGPPAVTVSFFYDERGE